MHTSKYPPPYCASINPKPYKKLYFPNPASAQIIISPRLFSSRIHPLLSAGGGGGEEEISTILQIFCLLDKKYFCVVGLKL